MLIGLFSCDMLKSGLRVAVDIGYKVKRRGQDRLHVIMLQGLILTDVQYWGFQQNIHIIRGWICIGVLLIFEHCNSRIAEGRKVIVGFCQKREQSTAEAMIKMSRVALQNMHLGKKGKCNWQQAGFLHYYQNVRECEEYFF